VWWVLGSFQHLIQQSLKQDIRTKAIVIHIMTVIFKGLLILLGFPYMNYYFMRNYYTVRSEVLRAIPVEITVFWDVTLCGLVDVY
jgi:hypothetical protein